MNPVFLRGRNAHCKRFSRCVPSPLNSIYAPCCDFPSATVSLEVKGRRPWIYLESSEHEVCVRSLCLLQHEVKYTATIIIHLSELVGISS